MGRICMAAAGAFGIAAAGGTLLHAQEVPTIDYVTVYAQKRAEPLQGVPVSLATLSGADLANAGIDDVDDLARALPTLDMQSSVSPVTTTLRIRRVGNLGNIPTFEPAVGLFIDGAYRSRSLLGTADLLDVDHIEVLNGPQSTLYGKNVSAGVVSVFTRRPGPAFTGEAELTGGQIDAPDAAAMAGMKVRVGGPLTPTWGASLAAAYSQSGATLMNSLPGGPDGNDLSRTTVRGQLSWSASEQLELRLIAGYLRENDNQGESDVYLAPGANSTLVETALQQQGVVPCPVNQPHDRQSCSPFTNRLDLQATDLTLLADYRLGNGWLINSVTSWDRYDDSRYEDDAVQLLTPLLFFRDSEQGTSMQQELRLSSADSASITWMTGLSWYSNQYQRGSGGKLPMFGPDGSLAFSPFWVPALRLPLALPGQLGLHDSQVDTTYYSAFGQVAWPLGQRFKLTGALRWQSEEKQASIHNSVTQPGASVVSVLLAPSLSPTGAPVNGSLHRTTDYLTGSLTPQYRFSDDLMAWLTVARGGKSGGFNTGFGNAPLSDREFGDETIDHLEVGTRANLAQGRVRLSASAFHTRYHEYQDAAFISGQFSVGNAEQVDLKGAEFEGTAMLGSGTTLGLAASYADLTYARNTTGMCYPGRVPDGSLPRSCDLRGEHPIDAPPWVVNASLQHTRPANWGSLFARLDVSWTDRYNTSFSADPRLKQDSHFDVGLRIGTRIGERLEGVLWADNLLDETVVNIDAVLNLFNDASYQSYLTQPRTIGMTLKVFF